MKSVYFVQFFIKGIVSGKLIEACGDTSVFILDGRNNITTMHEDVRQRTQKLKKIFKPIAYQIRKGTFSNYKELTKIINL